MIDGKPWPILASQPIPHGYTPESTPHEAELLGIHLVDLGQGTSLSLVFAFLVVSSSNARSVGRKTADSRRLLCSFTARAGNYSEIILWPEARHMVNRMYCAFRIDTKSALLIYPCFFL